MAVLDLFPSIYGPKTSRFASLMICVLFLAFLPISSVAQGGEWVPKASTTKAGGYGEAVTGTGNYVYVIRGWSQDNCQFWMYNPGDDSWATVKDWDPEEHDAPLPRPKNGASLAWDQGNYVYTLLGAAYADSDRRYFYRYSIAVNSWERLSDTPHAQGAGDALAWSGYDGSFYAFIGSRKHNTVFARYLLGTNTWEMLPSTWTLTDDGASLVWTGGEYLYALRGEWEEANPHNDFARYHILTGTWQNLAPIPVSNGVGDGGSLLWVGNWISEYSDYIFALGGNDVDENPGYGFYRYSISSNNWIELEKIPHPVGFYVGNRFGFAGGHIYYWQGAPSTWSGGGIKFCMFKFSLSEVSSQILSASASTVYFIYADPYRMVSSTAPWSAAFAAYDATAAGFIYGLCANTQRICYDSNASIVVAKSPESSPPSNYGKVLLSSKSVVVMGGPIPNWVVDYYERTGQTPLRYSGNGTHHCFLTQAGGTVAALSASADFTHNDLFVVMVFQDTNGNFVFIIYGLGWKGTFAGGILFKEVISKSLASYTGSAYVYKWSEPVSGDGVPQVTEIVQVYPPP